MIKTMIAGVTALSLSVMPLQAQEFNDDDFGKFLFGLVAAGIVATALSNRNDNDSAPAYQPVQPRALNPNYHAPPVVQNNAPRLNPGPVRDRGGIQPRHNAKVLPARCFKSVETRFGTQNMFARRCLTENYRYAARLPQSCAVRVLTRDAAHNGFDPSCLRRQGYATARR